MKKIISVLLSVLLVATLFTGCSGKKDNETTNSNEPSVTKDAASAEATAVPEEVKEIVVLLPAMGQEPVDFQKIEDAMNAITVPQISVKVDLQTSSMATYTQQVTMKMNSGEALDLIASTGVDMNTAIQQNQLMPLDDLIAQYGQDLTTAIPELFMNACKRNGVQYMIPAVRGAAAQPELVMRIDILEKLGYTMEDLKNIKTFDDFEPILAKVKENYPDMVPFAPIIASVTAPSVSAVGGLNAGYTTLDPLVNSLGVLVGDSTTVENYYVTDMFKNDCETMYDWYQKGYVWKDAATSSTNAIDMYLFSGTLFCFAFSSGTDNTEPWLKPVSGVFANAPSVDVPIGRATLNTSDITTKSIVIPSTSKNPEAAMKFLNLFYTSKELTNLLYFGIEGEHYTLDENGLMVETENRRNYMTSFNMSIGTQMLANNWASDGADYFQNMIKMTLSAQASPALGFYPDMTEVSSESVSLTNVCSKYLGALLSGAVDPSTELPKFLAELDASGINKVIELKQQQLDAHLSSQK